jgi:hypothetical protein
LEFAAAIFFELGICSEKTPKFPANRWRIDCSRVSHDSFRRDLMNKHLIHGLAVGAVFTVMITWVAASDALAEGGLALLASIVFGLSAGLCIGGLIAANFAMLAAEEKVTKEKPVTSATPQTAAHVHA